MLFGRNIISPADFRSALISPLLWERFCVGQIFLLRFRQIFRFSFREIFPIIDFPRRPLLLLRTDTRLTLFGIRTNWKYFILGTNIYPFVLDCSFWALSVFSFERKNNILELWLLLLLFCENLLLRWGLLQQLPALPGACWLPNSTVLYFIWMIYKS